MPVRENADGFLLCSEGAEGPIRLLHLRLVITSGDRTAARASSVLGDGIHLPGNR